MSGWMPSFTMPVRGRGVFHARNPPRTCRRVVAIIATSTFTSICSVPRRIIVITNILGGTVALMVTRAVLVRRRMPIASFATLAFFRAVRIVGIGAFLGRKVTVRATTVAVILARHSARNEDERRKEKNERKNDVKLNWVCKEDFMLAEILSRKKKK